MVLKILLGNTCESCEPVLPLPRCCLPSLLQIENGVELAAGPSVLPWPVLDSAEHEAIQGFRRNSSRNFNANKNKYCPVKWLTQVRLGKWQQPVSELFSVTGLVFCTLAPRFLLLHTKIPSEKLNSYSSWERAVTRWDLVLFCLVSGSFLQAKRPSLSVEGVELAARR